MEKRLFDIVTLSDNLNTRHAPKIKTHYLKGGYKLIKRKYPLDDNLGDPVSVIIGGAGVISQLLPNLFGPDRATAADFEKLFPGSGFWTLKFRNYIASKIKYKKDITRDIQMYTLQFVIDNNNAICPGTYTFQNPPGSNTGGSWNPCIQKFYEILRLEAQTGGAYPVGTYAPGLAGINWLEIAPYAIGGIALFVLLQSKKKRK